MVEYHLKTPLSEEDVRKLKVGDIVYISGKIFAARDAAHKKILELLKKGERLPFDPQGLLVYHVGPVVKKVGDKWQVVAAGPTTSARMEIMEAEFIEMTGIRGVIGKGGMFERTTEAMRKFGAFYGAFVGGAALLAAKAIEDVEDVFWLEELGVPEAVWLFKVRDFGPLIVAIDSHGNNLYMDVINKAKVQLEVLLKSL
ncbi:MAG: FumA C-terminus/TtdB family hydratase beta subunit [Crenarchaeota archaeon]|nr:FumA C-terminus/TtdB family hydratase beta subunit [Thermoproteota archaeon]MCR8453685.1 FumA C-terminus/TtdB family hydratase beta subunit [Thermoproteota archaeon]MCR8455385.1 FumA C-terminus/TtdB family hydratase beta subunit [Thermoproteota archaeon]MCR8471254.1 FumA C-terminus/TtdB family hydratase beta subunit [Thermoproteota archaeon]MCR8472053.1 FumA C-terminus/TtdB family hydratase beta subunit [Thermoproteota archaeon]